MSEQISDFLEEIRQIPGFEAAARTDACWHQYVSEIESTFHAIGSASEHCLPLRDVHDALLSAIASTGTNVDWRLARVRELFKRAASISRTLH